MSDNGPTWPDARAIDVDGSLWLRIPDGPWEGMWIDSETYAEARTLDGECLTWRDLTEKHAPVAAVA